MGILLFYLILFFYFLIDSWALTHCWWWRCLGPCSAQPEWWRIPDPTPRSSRCGRCLRSPGAPQSRARTRAAPACRGSGRRRVCDRDSTTCTTTGPLESARRRWCTDTAGPPAGRASQSAARHEPRPARPHPATPLTSRETHEEHEHITNKAQKLWDVECVCLSAVTLSLSSLLRAADSAHTACLNTFNHQQLLDFSWLLVVRNVKQCPQHIYLPLCDIFL